MYSVWEKTRQLRHNVPGYSGYSISEENQKKGALKYELLLLDRFVISQSRISIYLEKWKAICRYICTLEKLRWIYIESYRTDKKACGNIEESPDILNRILRSCSIYQGIVFWLPKIMRDFHSYRRKEGLFQLCCLHIILQHRHQQ